VFEVDDPRSPLEMAEDAGGVAQRFGQLRVKDAADLGLGAQEMQQLGSQQAEPPAQPAGIQADLQLWRDHLAAQGLDPATAGALESRFRGPEPPALLFSEVAVHCRRCAVGERCRCGRACRG
jgi:hypothetical protein